MASNILINGQPERSVDVTDRGFAYGQGVFETIVLNKNQPIAWSLHMQRLQTGANRLGIPVTPDLIDQLEYDLQQLLALQTNLPERQILKVTVTRGSGGRGYAVSGPLKPNRVVALNPYPEYPDQPAQNGISVIKCQTRLALSPLLAGIKHLNRLEQVLARAEWDDSSIREGLVLDADGYLAEGTMSNLFWVKDNHLYTPELARCGVAGIVRQRIMSIASDLGLAISLGDFSEAELDLCDELFVCNSVIGIWPVIKIIQLNQTEQKLTIGPVSRLLQQQLAVEGIY